MESNPLLRFCPFFQPIRSQQKLCIPNSMVMNKTLLIYGNKDNTNVGKIFIHRRFMASFCSFNSAALNRYFNCGIGTVSMLNLVDKEHDLCSDRKV